MHYLELLNYYLERLNCYLELPFFQNPSKINLRSTILPFFLPTFALYLHFHRYSCVVGTFFHFSALIPWWYLSCLYLSVFTKEDMHSILIFPIFSCSLDFPFFLLLFFPIKIYQSSVTSFSFLTSRPPLWGPANKDWFIELLLDQNWFTDLHILISRTELDTFSWKLDTWLWKLHFWMDANRSIAGIILLGARLQLWVKHHTTSWVNIILLHTS